MKKNILCILGVISLLGGLVSCGDNISATSTSDSTIVSDSTTDPVTIRFWHTFGKTVTNGIQKKIDSFEKAVKDNEGVDVDIEMEYQGSYDDIVTKVEKGFATSNTPTITVAYPDHVAEYLDSESTPGEYVVNLDEYMDDEDIGFNKEAYLGDGSKDDFVSSFMTEGENYVSEGTYSLPMMKSTEVMFYNEDLLSSILSDYAPGNSSSAQIKRYMSNISWDDFMDLCKYINDYKAVYSDSIKYSCIYDSDSNLFISHSYQKDIPFISIKDGEGSVDFNNDAAKDMVSKFKQNYDDGCFTTKEILGEYGSNYFKEAQSVFSIGSSGGAAYNMPTNSTFTFEVCKVPAENDNPLYVTQGPTLALLKSKNYTTEENSQKVKYAWKFLKYITNTENNADLCFNYSQGYVPVRESSYEGDDYQEIIDAQDDFAKNIEVVANEIDGKYLTTACFAGSATARNQVGGILANVIAGDSVAEAFDYAYGQTTLAM